LQRDLFVPFIANLKKRCESFDIMSTVDYRRLARQLLHTNFFVGEANRMTRRPATLSLSVIECVRGKCGHMAPSQWTSPSQSCFAPPILKPQPWLLAVMWIAGRSRRGLTSSEKLEETFLLITGSSVPIAPTTIEVPSTPRGWRAPCIT
jgi:hypothetical protein